MLLKLLGGYGSQRVGNQNSEVIRSETPNQLQKQSQSTHRNNLTFIDIDDKLTFQSYHFNPF